MGESVLATGSFDASAGIWRRWEEGAGKGQMGGETDFTGGLAGGDADGQDEEDDEWRFAVILDGHDSEIKSLAFSPTAPLLATCSRDKSVWIWEELEDDNFETVAVLQDHEGDVKCVAWHPSEELLASASYDDNVRLWREDVDDWACCALLSGHEGTVWWVEFEGVENVERLLLQNNLSEEQKTLLESRKKAGSRLMSCSDDHTIRVWQKKPKEGADGSTGQSKMPSIWKNRNFEEEWFEEGRLPAIHERPVYAITWSKKTGRVASTGSDGKIVIYEERLAGKDVNGDVAMTDGDQGQPKSHQSLIEWVVVAEIDNAHDVFEINHVVWAPRADKDRSSNDEEVLISTGDDGEVKVWTLDP